MEENIKNPKSNSKGLLITLIILLIIVIIGGAIVISLMYSKMSDLKEDVKSDIAKVENQIDKDKDADQTKDTEEVVKEDEEEENIEDPEKPAEPEEIEYYSRKYGFGFTFPGTWEDYEVVEKDTKWEDFTAPSLYFGFDDQEGLFAVSVFTKEQWDKLKDSPDVRQIAYLGENSQYVFVWSHSQYLANYEMEKRASEVPDIIKTFYTDAK